ncbi:uncharacterized protein LOC114806393 isoform X2 [Ornithorhynchus anatinus]|uniref:uncharacterized protein LOC114806393 isoform X2 n=1 Tax=Ornithorhynchus anatinus TaxID=9258 RepID=UPI0010A8FB62|nr:uncharacterized protein LOC114806393 isoform X2 [Ornithorhynchus anatinus]
MNEKNKRKAESSEEDEISSFQAKRATSRSSQEDININQDGMELDWMLNFDDFESIVEVPTAIEQTDKEEAPVDNVSNDETVIPSGQSRQWDGFDDIFSQELFSKSSVSMSGSVQDLNSPHHPFMSDAQLEYSNDLSMLLGQEETKKSPFQSQNINLFEAVGSEDYDQRSGVELFPQESTDENHFINEMTFTLDTENPEYNNMEAGHSAEIVRFGQNEEWFLQSGDAQAAGQKQTSAEERATLWDFSRGKSDSQDKGILELLRGWEDDPSPERRENEESGITTTLFNSNLTVPAPEQSLGGQAEEEGSSWNPQAFEAFPIFSELETRSFFNFDHPASSTFGELGNLREEKGITKDLAKWSSELEGSSVLSVFRKTVQEKRQETEDEGLPASLEQNWVSSSTDQKEFSPFREQGVQSLRSFLDDWGDQNDPPGARKSDKKEKAAQLPKRRDGLADPDEETKTRKSIRESFTEGDDSFISSTTNSNNSNWKGSGYLDLDLSLEDQSKAVVEDEIKDVFDDKLQDVMEDKLQNVMEDKVQDIFEGHIFKYSPEQQNSLNFDSILAMPGSYPWTDVGQTSSNLPVSLEDQSCQNNQKSSLEEKCSSTQEEDATETVCGLALELSDLNRLVMNTYKKMKRFKGQKGQYNTTFF